MQSDPLTFMKLLDSMSVGGCQIMGRLKDVPLTAGLSDMKPQICASFIMKWGRSIICF